MHFSLILIGAHDGSKTEALVRAATGVGQVLLVEPVPWLFERLKHKYGGKENLHLRMNALSDCEGEVVFFAPKKSANGVKPWGDQLGSLNPTHAKDHDPRFLEHAVPLEVVALRLKTLFKEHDVSSLDVLMTDTEGHDMKILGELPTMEVFPERIVFEHKHSDGVNCIGRSFASTLTMLGDQGYKVRILDQENALAVRKDPAHAAQEFKKLKLSTVLRPAGRVRRRDKVRRALGRGLRLALRFLPARTK